jgi:hypothetical protein
LQGKTNSAKKSSSCMGKESEDEDSSDDEKLDVINSEYLTGITHIKIKVDCFESLFDLPFRGSRFSCKE